MPTSHVRRDNADSLHAYPALRDVARILDISASTLSRRKDVQAEPRGDRDLAVRPAEVMRLALLYRRRSLNEVAALLLECIAERAPDEVARAEYEVDQFVAGMSSPDSGDDFLARAEALLPTDLYEQVAAVISANGDLALESIGGVGEEAIDAAPGSTIERPVVAAGGR